MKRRIRPLVAKEPTAQELARRPLIEELRELSTQPFIDLLNKALKAQPSEAALAKMAKERPSDWATYVKTIANLAGFAEKREVKVGGVLAHIHEMSDAELLDHAKRLTAPMNGYRLLEHVNDAEVVRTMAEPDGTECG